MVLGLGVEEGAMVQASITRFTGLGQPTVVVASAGKIESQDRPKPALRLIQGGAS
jgi:hypothetical protein